MAGFAASSTPEQEFENLIKQKSAAGTPEEEFEKVVNQAANKQHSAVVLPRYGNLSRLPGHKPPMTQAESMPAGLGMSPPPAPSIFSDEGLGGAIGVVSKAERFLNEPLEKLSEKGAEIGRKSFDPIAPYSDKEKAELRSKGVEVYEPPEWAVGVGHGIGAVVGSTLADPRNWPFLASSAARPILQRIISGGFGVQMSVGTVKAAKRLFADWDKLTPRERAEQGTQAGLSALMAAGSVSHAARGGGELEESPNGKAQEEPVQNETLPEKPAVKSEDERLKEAFAKSRSVGNAEGDLFAKAKAELFPDKRELSNAEISKVEARARQMSKQMTQPPGYEVTPTGRPLTQSEKDVQRQPGTSGVAKDIGEWQPPPELGAFSAPDYGQKARSETESRMGGPLPRSQAERRTATGDVPRSFQPPPAVPEGSEVTPKESPTTASIEPEKGSPGWVGKVPTMDIVADPKRFQFRSTVSDLGLGEIDTYDPKLAGIVSVWKDPVDGKTYAVNGHHRLDLANRAKEPEMLVQYLDAEDAKEARAQGALINIAEGNATPLDAAKYFRDTGMTADDLKTAGVSLSGRIARQGMALSHLSEGIFSRVIDGELPVGRAAVIGEELPDMPDQSALLQLLESKGKQGVRLSDNEVRNLARFAKSDHKITQQQETLFGPEEVAKSNLVEKAQLSSYIEKQLSRDKKLFGFVAKSERAKELARAGNVIDVEKSGEVAQAATVAQEVYNKLVDRKGPVSDALNEGAARLAKGEDPNVVRAETYSRINAAVSEALSGSETASTSRTEESAATSPATPDFGQWLLDTGIDPERLTLKDRDGLYRQWENLGMTEDRLREVLKSHPVIGPVADDLVDSAAVISKNAVDMPLDEFLKQHLKDVRFEGEPGAEALRQDPDILRSWVRTAGNVSIEPYGEQLSLFGKPEKVYVLRTKSGREAMVLESQMDDLALENKNLRQKWDWIRTQGTEVPKEVSRAADKDAEPEQPTLFQGFKGATKFVNDTHAVMYLFKNADVSTFLHEFVHTLEPYLKAGDRSVIDKWLDTEGIENPTSRKEALASAFEEYHLNGTAPTPEVKTVFARIQEMMRKIYETLKDSSLVKPSKEVAALFDRWYGKESPIDLDSLKTAGMTLEQELESVIGRKLNPEPTPSLFDTGEQRRPILDTEYKPEALTDVPPDFIPGDFPPGPGAKNVGVRRETPADIIQLRDSLAAVTSPDQGLRERLKVADRLASARSATADSVTSTWNNVKATAAALWNAYRKPLPWTDFKDMLGKWQFADQKAENDAYQFAREIKKQVPNKLRREAIINYIEAEGDPTTLLERYLRSDGQYKEGYRIAGELTDSERVLADNVRNYFESRLQAAIDAGFLEQGVDNYVHRILKNPEKNAAWQKLRGEIAMGKLQTNPRFAKKRFWETSFDAEQAGAKHVNKDIGFVITAYDLSFNRALSARAFIKSMLKGRAEDSRPLVAVTGSGRKIEEGDVGPESYVIRPSTLPEETADYRVIDHPALRKWKWATQDADGKPVFIQGDLAVHPDAYQHLKNVLSSSVLRNYAITRWPLEAFGTLKSTMLSLSLFHQQQIATHAIGHWVNPTVVPEISWDDPLDRGLIEHGLQVSNHYALEQFSEGVGGSGLIKHVPAVGPLAVDYQEYLFGDYIPRLKMKMAKAAFERNSARYPELTRDQLLEKTSEQANAAFGELNYKMLGRNPTLQDVMRIVLLAPDFLEARGRFAGQALSPYGREQAIALIRIGAVIWGGSRVMNMAFNDGDPKWDKPFSVVIDGKEYSVRSIPGDIYHLATDPRGFFMWRVNPFTVAPVMGLLYGRDRYGNKQDPTEAGKDYLKTVLPIPLQGLTKPQIEWWQALLESIGVRESPYRTEAATLAHQKHMDHLPQTRDKNAAEHNIRLRKLADLAKAGMATYEDLKDLPEADLKKILQHEKYNAFQLDFYSLGAKEAKEVWDVASPEERLEIRDMMVKKISHSRTLSPSEKEMMMNDVFKAIYNIPPPPSDGRSMGEPPALQR